MEHSNPFALQFFAQADKNSPAKVFSAHQTYGKLTRAMQSAPSGRKYMIRPARPESPGEWFATYRLRNDMPHRLSAEALGRMLGVSGTTVRRWEEGRILPKEADLRRFAVACCLDPLELDFLMLAFKAQEQEVAPDWERFSSMACEVLAAGVPAVLFDCFFITRGANSYALNLIPGFDGEWGEPRLFAHLMTERVDETSAETQDRRHQWMRRLWWSTAHLCGSQAYRQMLADFWTIEGFGETWVEMGNPPRPGSVPVGRAHVYPSPGGGTWLATLSNVSFPPMYYVVAYSPLNDEAMDWLRAQRASGAAEVILNPAWHWMVEAQPATAGQ